MYWALQNHGPIGHKFDVVTGAPVFFPCFVKVDIKICVRQRLSRPCTFVTRDLLDLGLSLGL